MTTAEIIEELKRLPKADLLKIAEFARQAVENRPLTPEQLGEPVWDEVTEYPFDGLWYRQRQEFFLVRVPSWEVDTRGFDQVERDSIDDHRWWEVAELESTDERVYPTDLASLMRRLLASDASESRC